MGKKAVNRSKKILAILLLTPLAVAIPVLGMQSHYSSYTSAQAADTSLQQRIINYRKNIKDKVSTAQQQKIKLRCGVAQTSAKSLASRLRNVQNKRVSAYDAILKRLNALLARLDEQAFETTALKENINELTIKVSDFKTSMAAYNQAVTDLSVINCTEDPTAFIAALNTARIHHTKLLTLVSDIRSYISNTIKPTLQQIKAQIESGQTTGGSQ